MTRGGRTALTRRPRLDDVAARVGLSPASLSLVLRNAPDPSEATRQRVFEGVGLAVDHLVELGHRDIAYVDSGKGAIAADRRRGYQKAMRRGLGGRVNVTAGDHIEESGIRDGRIFLQRRLPTAVITVNDRCALGLLDVSSYSDVRVGRGTTGPPT